MVISNKLGDYHISDKSAMYGFGHGGGIYFRTKSGKWKFNGIAQPVGNAIEVPAGDINKETKLPWVLDATTFKEVSA